MVVCVNKWKYVLFFAAVRLGVAARARSLSLSHTHIHTHTHTYTYVVGMYIHTHTAPPIHTHTATHTHIGRCVLRNRRFSMFWSRLSRSFRLWLFFSLRPPSPRWWKRCVCVWERERERERVCVCVYVSTRRNSAYISAHTLTRSLTLSHTHTLRCI